MSDHEKQPYIDPEVEKDLPAPLADAIRNGSVPDTILKHSHDADEAMKAFASHQGEVIHIDEATNKRLLRRIDWNLIPVRT
jgi:MFS transporter, ACS family, allantoate permease